MVLIILGNILTILIVIMSVFLLFLTVRPLLKDKTVEPITETADVMVISRRVSGNSGHMGKFYVTVEFEDGHRKELRINFKEYGLVAEGDKGELTFKGDVFLNFDRKENVQLQFGHAAQEYCPHCGSIFAEGALKCDSCGAARKKE